MKPSARLSPSSNFNDFVSLLDQYATFAEESGRKVFRSTPEDGYRVFSVLSPERQSHLLHRLENDVSILKLMLKENEDLNNSKQMLWRFLQKSGLSPCSGIFEEINVGDIVEVYSPAQVHLWQNLDFFDWCSRSLECIYTEAWHQSTKRDQEHHDRLAEWARRMLSGELREAVDPGTPFHLVEEVDSELLLKFELRVKSLSPVFENGAVAGLIAINECREPV